MKKQNGFTLVEIAIVLVVIGLLLGGVLKGQELLENGRIRKALNDFNTVAAATFTYQDRYRELPGDDDGANARFGADAVSAGTAATNGDGDGTIGDGTDANGWNVVATDTETFWQHLRVDGLIEGAPTAPLPANAFNGDTGVMFQNFDIEDEHVICMDEVTIKSAMIMDTRIDDGDNQTGSFQVNDEDTVDVGNTPPNALTVADGGRGTVCREL